MSTQLKPFALKEANSFVKFHPSEFVSFIVSDFFETYFTKDKDALIAEFFDSQGYLGSEAQKNKGQDRFEEAMRAALRTSERIRAKRRGLRGRKRKQLAKVEDA